MVTTVQISEKLQEKLKKAKLYDSESYEDVIWDLLEDRMELSEETKKHILESEKEIQDGRTKTLDQLRKELGL